MSQFVAALSTARRPPIGRPDPRWFRGLALAAIVALALISAETFHVIVDALSEAYIAVSVFVAGTLALVYGLERLLRVDIGEVLLRMRRWQVAAAALLGAFPGCGGAIVIVTQFARGHASFGSLVATLTATMGDAMFLLLAREPQTGLAVLALGVVVGAVSGWVIDGLHRPGFLVPGRGERPVRLDSGAGEAKPSDRSAWLDRAWVALMVPGVVIGLLAAFQVEVDALLGPLSALEPAFWLGVAGAALALVLWAARGGGGGAEASCGARDNRVIDQTNFITSWVVFAFLASELFLHFTGADLAAVFALWAPLVPLMAILVGWLPGCGPPLVITSLYLSGSLPLSAQLGNAISNDGDALFPALVLAPKAALLATLYSTFPALIVGYGAYLLWE